MKKIATLTSIILIIILTGCIPAPTPTIIPTKIPVGLTPIIVPPSPTTTEVLSTAVPGKTLDDFKNMVFLAPEIQKSIQLLDGKFNETLADGSTLLVNLDDHAAFGDINGDGIEDTALLLVESMGGTGFFVSLTAMVSKDGGYVQTNSSYIDDRPIIHAISIVGSEIILNVNVHGINDPMVDPTVNMTKSFRLFNEELSLWQQTILMADGAVRGINIDTPLDNAEVGGSVTISGSMPIAPFENNLQIQFIGESGMPSFVGGFMVTAEDMGKPATFNSTIPISGFPPGALVKIQLSEISMADGSSMLVDSVLVKMN